MRMPPCLGRFVLTADIAFTVGWLGTVRVSSQPP